jgi:hypothetical protein
MSAIEEKIKDFVKKQGLEVVGVAGPERLNGPPSLDPTYTMPGARSIVSLAAPMNVSAIYDFLSKKCQTGHNQDQLIWNQKLHHISTRVADYIRSLGFRAKAVPSNNTYRRSPDIFATHPSFSHRFGAIAAGIGAQGFSGNVMTEKYGAAVYLGTVVTDAVLKSDPALPPRYFIDNYCCKCRACSKSCVARMFIDEEEEYVLLNNELHPRGKRRDINFCNASCFGLHNLSEDKQWSSWGRHWIDSWIERPPDPERHSIRNDLLKKGSTVGDSTVRYRLIRNLGARLYPEEWIDNRNVVPRLEDLPEDELERRKFQSALIKKYIGLSIEDPNVLTCGQCALVCGPEIPESMKRLKMLRESGIVVSGKEGRTVIARNYDEARRIRQQFPVRVPWHKKALDVTLSTLMWIGLYGGFEPRSVFGNLAYQRRLKKAVANRIAGHRQASVSKTAAPFDNSAN